MLFLDSLKRIRKPTVEWSPLPRQARDGLKTLVLDLDETLVHSSLKFQPDADLRFELSVQDAGLQTVYVKIRPFLEQFLRWESLSNSNITEEIPTPDFKSNNELKLC